MPDTTRYCPKCGEACGPEDKFCTSCRAELRPTTSRPITTAPEQMPDRFNSDATELGLPSNAVLLHRYQVRKELGVGGMGRVYAADDLKLGIPVAIKVLRDVLRQDPGSVKRLISEAKASMMLAHPNIVRMNNFEDSETAKFLVMEYVEGETLAHLVAREGKLPEAEVRRIGIEICRGLEHAHSKRVIHRDMKPGNVMLGKDGSIKIADFGIARLCRDSMSRLTMQQDSGTLLYMAPEQLDGESNELTDLYSLGVVLYEMLAGDPPFITGEITAQIRYKAPRQIEGVSPETSRVVFKCLEKKPENRFSSVRALREELDGTAERNRAQDTGLEKLRAAAKKAFAEGKCAESIALWMEVLVLKPDDPEAAEAISRAKQLQEEAEKKEAAARDGQQQQQQKEQAQEDAAQNEKKKEDAEKLARLEELKARGKQAFDAGRYGEAIALWEEALALSPDDGGLKPALADARQRAELAKKEYEWKKWVDAVLAQANDLIRQGRAREAEAVLLQSLQHDPNNASFVELLKKVRETLSSAPTGLFKRKTATGKERRPRSLKKLLAYAIAAAVALFGLIVVIAIVSNDHGGNPSPNPVSNRMNPEPTNPGGDVEPTQPTPALSKQPPPPATDLTDIRGQWVYEATAILYGVPITITGQLQITGQPSQLHLRAMADYRLLELDGFWHQYRELNEYEGTFDGSHVAAQRSNASLWKDGYQVPPLATTSHLGLLVSPDGLSMRGQNVSELGAVNVTAQKR